MRVTRRRVIVDCHPAAEKFDDDEAGPDDRQRTAGVDASPGPHPPGVGKQYRHGGVGPDTGSAPPARQAHRTPRPPNWPPGAARAAKTLPLLRTARRSRGFLRLITGTPVHNAFAWDGAPRARSAQDSVSCGGHQRPETTCLFEPLCRCCAGIRGARSRASRCARAEDTASPRAPRGETWREATPPIAEEVARIGRSS